MMNNIEGGSLGGSESATTDAYTPANPANWNPAPSTVQEALDRLAAVISGNGTSPIP